MGLVVKVLCGHFCIACPRPLTRRYMQWRTKRWNLKNIYKIRASTLKN
ncbi:hypothetical protein DUG81_12525 [Vibrio parahaemolyticus]|nr:hypothetical protein [Vibrio parahaemolyticus]EGR2708005.1 hypothetical protein [Vibrio parahaemolyticus]